MAAPVAVAAVAPPAAPPPTNKEFEPAFLMAVAFQRRFPFLAA